MVWTLRCRNFSCTCACFGRCAAGSSGTLARGAGAMLQDLQVHLRMARVLCCRIFRCTCAWRGCYAAGSSVALAHGLDATLQDLHLRMVGTLRCRIFSCTGAWRGCYAARSSVARVPDERVHSFLLPWIWKKGEGRTHGKFRGRLTGEPGFVPDAQPGDFVQWEIQPMVQDLAKMMTLTLTTLDYICKSFPRTRNLFGLAALTTDGIFGPYAECSMPKKPLECRDWTWECQGECEKPGKVLKGENTHALHVAIWHISILKEFDNARNRGDHCQAELTNKVV